MTTSSLSMSAIGFYRHSVLSDADCLIGIELPRPLPGPHDVLVAVQAVSVNPVDTKIRVGLVSVPDSVNILGWDAAGIVEEVGECVTLFKPGQQVYYAGTFNRSGSNAQFHLVDERIVGHMPETLSFGGAAALPLTSLTAWQLLFERLGVVPGKPAGAGSLLVLGGAGGVGSMLIQLARRLTGLTVIATASHQASRDWCLALGAHHVIDHRQPLPEQIKALAIPPVNNIAALSHTAVHLLELAEIITPHGQIAIIDDHDSLDITPFKVKSVSVHWEMVFTRPLLGTADLIVQHQILNEVAALVDSGVLRSTVSHTLSPFNAAQLIEAHRLVEAGGSPGKVVVARG
ncbi:zinc-binding alcohol dehydrogenase family protein [Klebsiella sp. BIGb0407]|uniref:zinc-binding alcohol dehydrogenase family protein n=1 Tax=Klebsiella sp. BIGb0407 TaxID=2940603 RepID=UPI00216954AA|nr:zinc-binding alcohol dehydrogenase family protein [Klebsiella sp. BIGb0407]MCS3430315.1 zinc-binding alcohol dehydrogenase family protein [Klebsiella sp. BIGb0407]